MPDPSPACSESVAEVRRSIDAALASRDRSVAVAAAVSSVRAGDIAIADLYTQVLTPLLVDTGKAWQSGNTAVWEEHFASATVRTIIEALYLDVIAASSTVTRREDRVLLANPPQEQHDLGLRMLADRFELAGYRVTFLGADTPTAEIVAAARAVKATMVVLSASTHFNRVHLRTFVATLREGLPGVRIGVGGPAFALDRDWPAEELLDPASLGLPGAPVCGWCD